MKLAARSVHVPTNVGGLIMRKTVLGMAEAGLTLVLSLATAAAAPITFSGSGSSPAGIQATVDAFRAGLGTLNPNVAGSFGSGRREINWDGVPDAFADPNLLPLNFFNVNSPRGVVFSTPGSGFQVSGNAGVAPVEFDNLGAGYSGLSSFVQISADLQGESATFVQDSPPRCDTIRAIA